VPKLGWVKLVGWRPLGGDLRSITISRKAGHWYVSIAWRAEVADPTPSPLPDVGIGCASAIAATIRALPLPQEGT
jgi:putative transposase